MKNSIDLFKTGT